MDIPLQTSYNTHSQPRKQDQHHINARHDPFKQNPSVAGNGNGHHNNHPSLLDSYEDKKLPSATITSMSPPNDDSRINTPPLPLGRDPTATATASTLCHDPSHASKEEPTPESLIATNMHCILQHLGEDPYREGLAKTPSRYARAMLFFTSGYTTSLTSVVNDAIFSMPPNKSDIILVKDIDIFSLCEHHLVPFFGKIHIAYLPKNKVLGLSKFARIAEMFARRLQIQEKLGSEVAEAVEGVLDARGVMVVLEASHMCMVMRGVQKMGAVTVSVHRKGVFLNEEKMEERVWRMLGGRR